MQIIQGAKKELKKYKPSRNQLLLLSRIAASGRKGICLSKRELADDLSCSIKTIDRSVIRLKNLGLIEVQACHLASGQQVANMYRICENACKEIDWYCFSLESQVENR